MLINRLAWSAVAIALLAAVVCAAFTRPFTWPGNTVAAFGLAALVVVVLLQRRGESTPRAIMRHRSGAVGLEQRAWGHRWVLWIAPLAALATWEVLCYVGSPRSAHPTLSSMLDTVTTTHAGRGLAYASWLALGWYLVTR
jgi:hypothetical protein